VGERIHWDDSEWERIVQLATPLLIEDKKLTVIEAVRQVQDKAIIDPKRRRHLPNIGTIRPDIRMRLDGARKIAMGQVDHIAIDLYNEVVQRLDEANARIKVLTEELATVRNANTALAANKPRPPIDVIKDFVSDVIADALRKNSAETPPPVKVQFVQRTDAETEHHKKHNPQPEPSGVRKPRLVIVGGHQSQHQELQRAFGDDLRLQFFHGTSEQGRLGDQLRSFKDKAHGKILVWCDHVGHSAEDAIKFQNIPYERFRGEINALKERIRKYINGGGPTH
jgi:hypothetical protein